MTTPEGRRAFERFRLRIPPRAFDIGLVLVFAVAGVITSYLAPAQRGRDDLRWVAAALSIAVSIPLLWRRTRPALTLALCWAVVLPYLIADAPESVATATVYVATYSIAVYGDRRTSLIGGAASVAIIAGISALGVLYDEPDLDWTGVVANTVLMAITWLIGENIHVNRLRTSELEERARRLEHEAALEAARAAADERARIARELHDVVAHAVSTIVVQAGGARRVLERDPQQAGRALEVIETTGRDALVELRRVLDVLRADDENGGPLDPQPGIEQLPELVAALREAGIAVELDIRGTVFPLPAAVDLSAYRIVQEALTNVVKHAGEAHASVLVRYAAEGIRIGVTDDGRGAASELRESGGGHGIAGMRERASLVGGTLVAHPRPGGGYEVQAHLPVGSAR